jgi:DNA-binding transcriptional LysR family regulator
MKLDQLLYFLEVAKQEHMGHAAKALHITPSAISHSVAALERELGHALFHRERNRIFLSVQGKKLAELIEPLFLELETIKDKVASPDAELSGTFRIAGTHGYACKVISEAWGKLAHKHPKLLGECFSLKSGEILQKIRDRELDMGLCYSPQANAEYVRHVVKQEPLWVCVKKNHPILQVKRDQRFAELNQYPCAAPAVSTGIESCETHPVLVGLGLKSEVRFVFDSYAGAATFVEHTNYWSLLPEFLLKEGFALTPVDAEQNAASIDIALVWHARRPLTRVLRLLIERVEQVLSPLPNGSGA